MPDRPFGGKDTMRTRFLPETEQAQKLEMP